MKVYSTLIAVEALLQSGRIDRSTTLLDSSSGIYAYALALACHRYGLKCHIVGSQTLDHTLLLQLQILGVIEIVNEILASNENYHWMRQYHDDIHYSGYQAVAEYINTELGGADFTLVASVGSGCSSGGISSALRSAGQDVKLIGIQPFGSITFGSEYVEDPGIIMAGIGSSIPFDNVHHDLYDPIHWVSFDYARNGAIALLKDHAVFAGLSSGCCYLVASREVKRDSGQNVLFIAPDIVNRYVEGVFAHYGQAKPIEDLAPKIITRHSELALPWACMEWRRRPEPCNRLWRSDRITDEPPSYANSGGKSNIVPREGKNSSV